MANLYLPNTDQVASLEPILEKIESHQEGFLVLGGDLNVALDPLIDVSRGIYHLSYFKLLELRKHFTYIAL